MEDGPMAIGRKDTTPLWEVHAKAPEATRGLNVELNSGGQHKTRRACASVAEHCDLRPQKCLELALRWYQP